METTFRGLGLGKGPARSEALSASFANLPGASILVLDLAKELDYACAMSQTLEQRVEELERRVAQLSAQVLNLRPVRKNWRDTVGVLKDDEMTREAERLGREFRKQQTV